LNVDAGAGRRAAIARRWPRYRWDANAQARQDWRSRQLAFPIVTGCLISIAYLELALWRGEISPWWPFEPVYTTAAGRIALVLLIAINAWVLDRGLSSTTRGEWAMARWLLRLRLATIGVPLLGLGALPLWRWITDRRPPWAFRPACRPSLDLTTSGARSRGPSRLGARLETWRRRASRSLPGLVTWLIACQIVPLLAGLSWLGSEVAAGRGGKAVVTAACIPFHLVGWAAAAYYAGDRRRTWAPPGWGAWGLRLGPPLFLLPLPFPLLGVLCWLPAAEENREERTLTGAAGASRTTSPGIPRISPLPASRRVFYPLAEISSPRGTPLARFPP
jgi:hypothetical protein